MQGTEMICSRTYHNRRNKNNHAENGQDKVDCEPGQFDSCEHGARTEVQDHDNNTHRCLLSLPWPAAHHALLGQHRRQLDQSTSMRLPVPGQLQDSG